MANSKLSKLCTECAAQIYVGIAYLITYPPANSNVTISHFLSTERTNCKEHQSATTFTSFSLVSVVTLLH